MVELINRAKVHVYLADFSGCPYCRSSIKEALKSADARGVNIEIALYYGINDAHIRESWQAVEDLPHARIVAPKDSYLFADGNSVYMAADDAMFSHYTYEDRNQFVMEVVTGVETRSAEIDDFGMRVFGTNPKALSQAVEMHARKQAGLQWQDAVDFVNQSTENAGNFDLKTYQRNLRACFYAETAQSWNSSGADGQIEKANTLEMINRAKDVIYIVACTDSKNFDEDTARALYEAKHRGVEINVIVHKTADDLSSVWKDIQYNATRFHSILPVAELSTTREHVAADNTYRFETFDKETNKWMGITQTHTNQHYEMIHYFFYRRPWINAVVKHHKQTFSVKWHEIMKSNDRQNGN